MKVLFITLFSLDTNTSVTKSNIGLLEGLRKKGYDITILMPDLDSSLSYYDNTYDYSWANVIKIRNNGLSSKLASAINSKNSENKKILISIVRKLKRILYRFRLFDRTKELVKKKDFYNQLDNYYDYVISTSDPKSSHLLAKKLLKKRIKCSKWIQHWGDPLSGDISSNSIFPQCHIVRVERKILSRADKVVYVSPFTCEKMKQKHKKLSSKIAFVPLPCDLPISEKKQYSQNNQFKIVYLGDYSSKIRNIIPLYEAVKKTQNSFLRIAGNSDLLLESTHNVLVTKRVEQKQANELEKEANLVVCVANLYGTQIPGKLYYSASNGTPILVVLDGTEKSLLEAYLSRFNRFVFCDNTIEAIAKALTNIKDNYSEIQTNTPDSLYPDKIVEEILNE